MTFTSGMFDPRIALAAVAVTAVWLGLGWLAGRDRGLWRACWRAGLADVVIGLASGRMLTVVGGVVVLVGCLFWHGRRS